jgi:hypothetical protein
MSRRAALGSLVLTLGSGCGALLGIDDVPQPDEAGAEAAALDASGEAPADASIGEPQEEAQREAAAEAMANAKNDATTTSDAPSDAQPRDTGADARDARLDAPRLPNESATDAASRDAPTDVLRRVDAPAEAASSACDGACMCGAPPGMGLPFFSCTSATQCPLGYVCVDNNGDRVFYCKPVCATNADCDPFHAAFPTLVCTKASCANGAPGTSACNDHDGQLFSGYDTTSCCVGGDASL